MSMSDGKPVRIERMPLTTHPPRIGVGRTFDVEKALSRADRKLIGRTAGKGLSDIHIRHRVRCSQVVGVQHNAGSGLIDGRGPISIRLQVLLPGVVCEELQAMRHLILHLDVQRVVVRCRQWRSSVSTFDPMLGKGFSAWVTVPFPASAVEKGIWFSSMLPEAK